MTKPKLLCVITQGELGGAQRYVFDLATNLVDDFSAKGGPASGWDIIIAVVEPRGMTNLQDKIKRLKDYKITIIQLKHLVRDISPIHDTLAIFELAKLYKTLKPDIIHLNSSKAGILGSLAKALVQNWKLKIGNWKLVYTVHGWVFNEPLGIVKKMFYGWLEKFTARWKDKIIVLSDFDCQTGQQAGIPTDKLVKIPLGIETPKFLDIHEARQALAKITNYKLQITNFVVGTIANLYKTKGIDILIGAIKLIVDTERDSSATRSLSRAQSRDFARNDGGVKFIIIGEGPERKSLENLIKKYHLESTVYLVGTIDNAAQYLKAFDLFVLPSRKEGMPYTILEALSAGLPIIATDVGGIKELITSVITPNNTKLLAEKIIQTIKNPIYQQKNTSSLREMSEKTKATYLSCLPPKS